MSQRLSTSIDTNVILRFLLQDDADHSARAASLILKLRRGEDAVFCPATAVFEAIHILHGRAKISRTDIAQVLTELIAIPGIMMEHDAAVIDALAFWKDQPALDYADCYHLALTKELGMTRIYTFDRKMDRYPGVERVEP